MITVNCIVLLKKIISISTVKKTILAISYIMKVSEVEHSYNQFRMDKWNPETEVCCMSEEDLTRLDLSLEVLELLSIHMASKIPPHPDPCQQFLAIVGQA